MQHHFALFVQAPQQRVWWRDKGSTTLGGKEKRALARSRSRHGRGRGGGDRRCPSRRSTGEEGLSGGPAGRTLPARPRPRPFHTPQGRPVPRRGLPGPTAPHSLDDPCDGGAQEGGIELPQHRQPPLLGGAVQAHVTQQRGRCGGSRGSGGRRYRPAQQHQQPAQPGPPRRCPSHGARRSRRRAPRPQASPQR